MVLATAYRLHSLQPLDTSHHTLPPKYHELSINKWMEVPGENTAVGGWICTFLLSRTQDSMNSSVGNTSVHGLTPVHSHYYNLCGWSELHMMDPTHSKRWLHGTNLEVLWVAVIFGWQGDRLEILEMWCPLARHWQDLCMAHCAQWGARGISLPSPLEWTELL